MATMGVVSAFGRPQQQPAAQPRPLLDGKASWEHDPVRVTYQAGYGIDEVGDVYPLGDDLLTAMRLLLGHFWINRAANQATTGDAGAAVRRVLSAPAERRIDRHLTR